MFIRSLAALAVVFATAIPALAQDEVDPALKEKLTAQLVAEGYEVRKIIMEDGKIEAYVVKDGEMAELYFDETLTPVEGGEGDED